MDPPLSEEDIARMRREFEAARSFEESDDMLYGFMPVDEPSSEPAAIAAVPSKTAHPRLAALQNMGVQARDSETPPRRKNSLPRQYNPQIHGSWRPSVPTQAAGIPVKRDSLAEAKRVQNLLEQFAQGADVQGLVWRPETSAGRQRSSG